MQAFEGYKTIPQYRELNAGMSLSEFKTIFWWEWSHRLLGRVIGAVYLLPFLYFLWRGVLSSELKRRLWLIFGLGALQADFCVRIGDRSLAARLREHTGRAVFEAGNPVMGMILAANPHRVFISRLGRIEVYQPIPPPSGRSPEGPHTHVLPKLLRSGRTHPATEPIPEGLVPCAHLYPAHPARDALGEARPFEAKHHHAFQQMLAACGDPLALRIKRRVIDAVLAGEPPVEIAGDRHGRTSIRIALRQLKAKGHASSTLGVWLANFDSASSEEGDDEAALHHNG